MVSFTICVTCSRFLGVIGVCLSHGAKAGVVLGVVRKSPTHIFTLLVNCSDEIFVAVFGVGNCNSSFVCLHQLSCLSCSCLCHSHHTRQGFRVRRRSSHVGQLGDVEAIEIFR